MDNNRIHEVNLEVVRITLLNNKNETLLYASIDGEQRCCEKYGLMVEHNGVVRYNSAGNDDNSQAVTDLLNNRMIKSINHESTELYSAYGNTQYQYNINIHLVPLYISETDDDADDDADADDCDDIIILTFYNKHNGYYSHNVNIQYGDVNIFKTI
jgi:hypothetical protein